MISYPENDAQVIEVIRGARAEHRALRIFGAGTRTARDPDDDSAPVSSCQIRGIVDYEPAEW